MRIVLWLCFSLALSVSLPAFAKGGKAPRSSLSEWGQDNFTDSEEIMDKSKVMMMIEDIWGSQEKREPDSAGKDAAEKGLRDEVSNIEK